MRQTTLFQTLTVSFFLLILCGGAILVLTATPPGMIREERRPAATMPDPSPDLLLSGEYVSKAEAYALDALPVRRALYTLYSAVMTKILQNPTVNGIRLESGTLEKTPPAFDSALFCDNLDTVASYLDRFLSGRSAYFALVAHKGHYRARDTVYRDAWEGLVKDGRFLLVETVGTLSYTDYFHTDIHVRPECYGAFAQAIGDVMGFEPTFPDSVIPQLTAGGTLSEQMPLLERYGITDTFTRLDDRMGRIAAARVFRGDAVSGLYWDGALDEPYDLYLGRESESALAVIRNPRSESEKRLILFRESFARAFLPYLVSAYREIVVVDLRAPYRMLSGESRLFADDTTDILVMVSTHTLLSTRF